MSPKLPVKGTTTVDVHPRPNQTSDANLSRRGRLTKINFGLPDLEVIRPLPPGRTPPDVDLDAITPAPMITVHEVVEVRVPTDTLPPPDPSLERYRLGSTAGLPDANADGFRIHRGRRYVDLGDGGLTLLDTDPDTGLHRARLPSELTASGPVLLRDPDSGVWYTLVDVQPVTHPLTDRRLEAFRTELDFSGVEPASDGLYTHEGKRYALINRHAYQVIHDVDASTPAYPVWRIVKSADPVASDGENRYHATRSGESLAITRNEANDWVSIVVGLAGGMRRDEQAAKALLMQRYQPTHQAHIAMSESNKQFGVLYDEAKKLPENSAQRTGALIKAEVHALKHIKRQADFVKSLIDDKDWLIHLKSGGLYKSELHTFQMERLDYYNKLMAIMDLRVRPETTGATVENCKKTIAHLNKKLKILDDRQVVMDQVRKASPGAAPELAEITAQVPDADRINFSKLSFYLRLHSDDPVNPPDIGMQSLQAIDMFTRDLKNQSALDNPLVLLLAVEQIRMEKSQFEAQLTTAAPDKAEYIREIIALVEPFETRIDNRLSEIFASFDRSAELPSLDQSIDFDFVPQQPVYEDKVDAPPRKKMFRTRQHGTDRVLVGETESTPDGEVLKVANPLMPNAAPPRYENRQGEWRPVRPLIPDTPRPKLVKDANRLLAGVGEWLAEAKARETRKDNPTDIIEDLDMQADLLHEQARLLKNHQNAPGDSEILGLVARLQAAGDSLTAAGKSVLVRMYKNPQVLDILRLNYLLDHGEVTVTRTVNRKLLGKGDEKYFLDVYRINDGAGEKAALWEAHFKYDRHDREPLKFKPEKGAHLKTLEQAGRGLEAQRRDAQAGLPHVAIWRQSFDRKTATKIFDLMT
ncbi:hypothetical protein [Pseudomonas sp. A34-9]|uniref:hypothetical protein n=1 Tax=Pseudomonas sp. A34-9 TaxID=3034675 RepID=UPI00240D921D|nr:hypothetical protein [Pseudomonas sp. A34-9]